MFMNNTCCTCFCIILQKAVLALPSLRALASFWRASSSVEAAPAPSSNSPPAEDEYEYFPDSLQVVYNCAHALHVSFSVVLLFLYI